MQDYRKLDVWARAHELAVATYKAAHGAKGRPFPGLTAQMMRAASSIPANIAEGCGHESQRELARFLRHAIASAQELQYHLLLAHDLEILPSTEYARLDARVSQVRQMSSGLLRRVRAQPKPLPPKASPVGP